MQPVCTDKITGIFTTFVLDVNGFVPSTDTHCLHTEMTVLQFLKVIPQFLHLHILHCSGSNTFSPKIQPQKRVYKWHKGDNSNVTAWIKIFVFIILLSIYMKYIKCELHYI